MAGAAVNPYSDNVIFVDTEFSGLEFYLGDLISIGLVKLSGEELYLELEYAGPVNEFVQKHVLPGLTGPKVPPSEAVARIKEFVGAGRPYMLSEGGHYDVLYVYKLFGIEEHPFHWIPLEFASMLFCHGISLGADLIQHRKGGREPNQYPPHVRSGRVNSPPGVVPARVRGAPSLPG